MKIEELYQKKGKLITTIEISQSKLQEVNKQIAICMNQKKTDEKKTK